MPPGVARSVRTGPDGDSEWAHEAALAIWDRLTARDYAGWDPYDALNARFLPSALKNARFFRRALTQAAKRSPVPLQPFLGVGKQVDAYTLGHVLLAAARLSGRAGAGAGRGGTAARGGASSTGDGPTASGDPAPGGSLAPGGGPALPDWRQACHQIVTQLRSMARVDGESLAWGYHFPVHTRFFSYVPPTPNLIVTAFVAKGMAAVTRAGLVDCTAEVLAAARFVLHGLPRVTDQTGQCVGYVPGETAVVHNANMLAALVLCEAADLVRGGRIAPRGEAGARDAGALVDEALSCARFTVARQAADGSWPYSEESYGRWVDGFHTGFVLEGLARVARATGDPGLGAALNRGVRYYVAQLFGPAGEPKYYPHKAHPFDALPAAQGVETLQVALGGHAAQAVPRQLEWIRGHLVKAGGRVAYQEHRGWTDRREFPRWSSAPLMSALAGTATVAAGTPGAVAPAAVAQAAAPRDVGGGL